MTKNELGFVNSPGLAPFRALAGLCTWVRMSLIWRITWLKSRYAELIRVQFGRFREVGHSRSQICVSKSWYTSKVRHYKILRKIYTVG